MTSDVAKHAAAMAALRYVAPDIVLGVGSGTTVGHFLDALEEWPQRPRSAVAASRQTELRLRLLRIPVVPLGSADLPLPLYIDGADELDPYGRAIKGGGGAHWREKLVAGASRTWVCIVDESKLVDQLGTRAPVPLEVEFPDLADVEASVRDLGGAPFLREGALTDSGNPIVDVRGLDLHDPQAMETDLEAISGVLACGIFATRRADLIIVGRDDGSAYTLEPKPL
jgi:ribose 5-phosphate isomerase A